MAAKKTKEKGRLAVREPAQETLASLPSGYVELLDDLKDRIRRAQVRAAVAASRELIRLYWDIGREIVQRQEQEGWGYQGNRPIGGRPSEGIPWYCRLFTG
jgi:DUF1016 N-terminal domain